MYMKNFLRIFVFIAISILSLITLSSHTLAQTIDSSEPSDTQEIKNLTTTTQDQDSTNPSLNIANTTYQITFDIEIFIETQNPWNNKIPVTIRFIPSADVKETDISIIAPFGLEIDPKYKNYFPTKAGEVYEVDAFIIPVNSGSFDIAVDITAWTADSNFTSSKKFNITLNDSLIITPQQPGYAGAQIFKLVTILLAFALFIFLMIIVGKLGINKLKNWLKPPIYK